MHLESTLTRADLKLIKADLTSQGRKLPKVGYCVRLSNGVSVCRDVHGYYLTGSFPGITTPLAKGNVYV